MLRKGTIDDQAQWLRGAEETSATWGHPRPIQQDVPPMHTGQKLPDSWGTILRSAQYLLGKGKCAAEALFLGGLAVSEPVRGFVSTEVGIRHGELPLISEAADGAGSPIGQDMGAIVEDALGLVQNWKLVEAQDSSVLCLVLTAFSRLPPSLQAAYSGPPSADATWLRAHLGRFHRSRHGSGAAEPAEGQRAPTDLSRRMFLGLAPGRGERIVPAASAPCVRPPAPRSRMSLEFERVELKFKAVAESVHGQPHALRSLAQAYRRTLLGASDRSSSCPTVVLLTGPAGCGKRHLARQFAHHVVGGEFLDLGQGPELDTGALSSLGDRPANGPPPVLCLGNADEVLQQAASRLHRLAVALSGPIRAGGFSPPQATWVFLCVDADSAAAPDDCGLPDDPGVASPLRDLTTAEVLASSGLGATLVESVDLAIRLEAPTVPGLARISQKWIGLQEAGFEARTGMRLELDKDLGVLFTALHSAGDTAIDRLLFTVRREFWVRFQDQIIDRIQAGESYATIRVEVEWPGEAPDESLPAITLLDDEAESLVAELQSGTGGTWHCLHPLQSERIPGREITTDLVLLDLDWGKGPQRGIEMLRRFRKEGLKVPIYVYSRSAGSAETRRACYAAGADACVEKGSLSALKAAYSHLQSSIRVRRFRKLEYSEVGWNSFPLASDPRVLVVRLTPRKPR